MYASVSLARRDTRLARRESRLARRDSRLARRESRLARRETRGGNLLLSGTVDGQIKWAKSSSELVSLAGV